MTEKVCQLYEEEQLEKNREGRKGMPANKMPDLGWDIAETLEIKEGIQDNSTSLTLQTIITITTIISVIVRLTTTQLGKLARILKKMVPTTIGISRNKYLRNIKNFYNTATVAISIATSTTNHTVRNKTSPSNDRNDHISVDPRNQAMSMATRTNRTPQGGAVTTTTSMTNCTKFPSDLRKD